jgi:UDP-N-acetyl-2-amino-2-deoxyglucuronate dehydrogenase
VYVSDKTKTSGFIELENANVSWFLSIDRNDLPQEARDKNQSTYRSITVDGAEIEFSEGFTDLHTRMYEVTLAGQGFGLDVVRPSIELVHGMRNAKLAEPGDMAHPFVMNKTLSSVM